ncbi:uncharacterized protein B0H18DRAFT_14402 [Fomitopsis serialis]|uniref:uncharacterized protein n=1 Tax=Fomitopsis serialis TaxID=139415 RepID=UPI00200861D7|nr:uncharacterized protein B0H18DRAFT_14402 [Neoantrodia serialis]KAH9938417.1 hypothetical protein B0H18DRAFT_14402 [Neoantrodia serialis]
MGPDVTHGGRALSTATRLGGWLDVPLVPLAGQMRPQRGQRRHMTVGVHPASMAVVSLSERRLYKRRGEARFAWSIKGSLPTDRRKFCRRSRLRSITGARGTKEARSPWELCQYYISSLARHRLLSPGLFVRVVSFPFLDLGCPHLLRPPRPTIHPAGIQWTHRTLSNTPGLDSPPASSTSYRAPPRGLPLLPVPPARQHNLHRWNTPCTRRGARRPRLTRPRTRPANSRGVHNVSARIRNPLSLLVQRPSTHQCTLRDRHYHQPSLRLPPLSLPRAGQRQHPPTRVHEDYG